MPVSTRGVRWTARVAALLAALVSSAAVFAQDAGALRDMARPEDALAFPSVGRILGVLVLMIALAIGALYAIRRWQPKIQSHFGSGRSIKVLERSLVGGVRVYLVQVDDQRVLLSEHRGRVTTLLLPPGAPPAPPQS